MAHKLFTDGGARGNPGPAAIGGICTQDEREIFKFKKYVGKVTNNVAEYEALIYGLKLALENNITELQVFLDSELVVKQINGEYKVKNENMKPLYEVVKGLQKKFLNISFTHVPREQNKIADRLVNEALDDENI
jgi:ribonuclease HI